MFNAKYSFLILIFILLLFPDLPAQRRKNEGIFLGGKLGTAIPINVFNGDDPIGFADVATPGIIIGFDGKWIFEKRLSLGAELSYQYNPADKEFWDVARQGKVTAHYNTASLLLTGDYYFSHKDVRPYVGIAFGGFYIFNDLNFVSSYTGTDNDRSVNYKTRLWEPGFAPEGGIMFRLNKKTYLDINAKFIIIPNIPDQYENVYDENGYVIKVINKNPHGNENQIQISVSLFFGV